MPTVMSMRWPGVTLEDYEEARGKVRWEEDVADGAMFHVCGHDGEALRVLDIWESEDHFNRFAEERLMPIVKGEMGLEGDPEIVFYEVHRTFAPVGVEALAV